MNAQVQEFRASICSILGFKIDMQPQGKLKLSSIYSSMWTLEFDTHGNFLGFVGASTDRLQEGVVKHLWLHPNDNLKFLESFGSP